jgi:hypothetical protein
MTVSCGQLGDLVMRMQGDFLEIPGLTLTLQDGVRRFGVDTVTCDAVLATLAEANVLTRNCDGAYRRHFPLLACRWADANASRGKPANETSPFATHAA